MNNIIRRIGATLLWFILLWVAAIAATGITYAYKYRDTLSEVEAVAQLAEQYGVLIFIIAFIVTLILAFKGWLPGTS